MQKLNMIEAFAELAEGADALFVHPAGQADQARLIKMRINAPQETNLYITALEYDDETGEVLSHDEKPRFLAHVRPGFEHIEFFYRGSFSLAVVGGSIWLDTYDNTAFSVEATDYTNYARLWEREERDPRILEIERMARHNQNLLREQMAADMAAYAAALEERMKSNVASASAPASGGTASVEPSVSTVVPAGDSATTTAVAGGTGGEPDGGA